MTRPDAHATTLASALAGAATEAGHGVLRAMEHAGLGAEVSAATLSSMRADDVAYALSTTRDGSAEHLALESLSLYQRGLEAAGRATFDDPTSAGRWFVAALTVAAQALRAPAPAPGATLATGITMAREVERDGVIGLAIEGYASRYDELDAEGQRMGKKALQGIHEQWAADPTPPLYWEHGRDGAIGWRPLGHATEVQLDDTGLYIVGWVPREPDPRRFTGAARLRQPEVYDMVRTGQARGYSVGGTYQNVGEELRQWNCNDVSIGRTPILASARFTLRAAAAM